MVRADDSTVDHNHFHGKSTLGIYLGIEGANTEEMAQRVHVYRNYFSDHTFPGSNGGEPIRLGVSPELCPAPMRSWSTTCSSAPTAIPRRSR